VLRTGLAEPTRLTGPTRSEPAYGPLPGVGVPCGTTGGAWRAPVPSGQPAGHGTAGHTAAPGTAASGRARTPGWRMVSRALVTGGFLLCGWFIASSGHAYASTITAPPAPHPLLAGVQASGSGASLAQPVTSARSAARTGLNGQTASTPAQSGAAQSSPQASAPGQASGQAAAPGQATAASGSQASDPLSAAHGLGGLLSSAGAGQAGSLLSSLGRPGSGLMPTGSTPAVVSVPSISPSDPGGPAIIPAAISPATSPAATHPAGTSPLKAAAVQGHLVALSAHRARPVASGPSPDGYQAAAGAPHARPHHARPVRHPGPSARRSRLPHRTPPGARLGTGAATQTDPTSSGGGTGTAQMAAPALSGSDRWAPAGRLIRVRMSRWPAVHQAVDDPAVSPD